MYVKFLSFSYINRFKKTNKKQKTKKKERKEKRKPEANVYRKK